MEEVKLICVLPIFVSNEEREICKFTYGDEFNRNIIQDYIIEIFSDIAKSKLPFADIYQKNDSLAIYAPEDLVEEYLQTLCTIAIGCGMEKKICFKYNHELSPVMVGKIYDLLPTREEYNLGQSKYDIDCENSIIM